MTRTLGLVALFALMLASVALAQTTGSAVPPAPPPPPTMSAEGKKFVDGWLGRWTSSDTMYTVGSQKMQGSLKLSCERVSSGWGAACKGTFSAASMPPMEMALLMGWDIATGQAHMFEVADSAEVHDHSGAWTNDKSIVLARQGKTVDGKVEKDACTATWLSGSELQFDCTGSQEGTTVWTFTSKNTKQ